MKVVVDSGSCLLSGLCAEAEPAAFVQDADGVAHATDEAGELPLERLKELARGCPSSAIELYVDGERVDPFA